MSRATARTAIVAYLNSKGSGTGGDGTIPFLNSVFGFPQKFTPEGDFFAGEDPGMQGGAMIFLYFEPQKSTRAELRGANAGGKFVDFPAAMNIVFRSMRAKTQDAAEDNESMLDGLLKAINDSKTAGTSDGSVWSWGEGGTGKGSDLELTSFYPRPLSGANAVTEINSRLIVQVVQFQTSDG